MGPEKSKELDPFKLVDVAIDTVRSGISGNSFVREHMKRASSTLYYALFHCLAQSNADALAGKSRGDAWTRVYRALGHREAAKRCRGIGANSEFPPAVQQFADIFCIAQEEREQADYNPDFAGRTPGALILGALAVRTAMLAFNGVPTGDRRNFAVYLLFKPRRSV